MIAWRITTAEAHKPTQPPDPTLTPSRAEQHITDEDRAALHRGHS